ncbi:MAG: hypothetical protein WA414_01245 [Acidobacteriaceae bacterium]
MSAGRVLKSYLWWTHERGSIHYDVMVTLILAFIFLTPHWVHYGDQPKPDWPANEIRAAVNPAGGMIYEVPVNLVHASAAEPTNQDLVNAIAPIAGSIAIDRFEPVHVIGGSVVAWRVWGHRPS